MQFVCSKHFDTHPNILYVDSYIDKDYMAYMTFLNIYKKFTFSYLVH